MVYVMSECKVLVGFGPFMMMFRILVRITYWVGRCWSKVCEGVGFWLWLNCPIVIGDY